MADTSKNLRNLEPAGSIYINKWWTGLYKNRSALFTPVSALGIQLISRQDTLWDGANLMITPQFTLRRRYGFTKASTVAFNSAEFPLTFFSFQQLSGTIIPIVDTQTHVSTFSSSTLVNIYTKTTTQQSSFNDVGNILYWCDGTVAKKWDGATLSNMGIVAPLIAPTLSYIANGSLEPLIGYQYGYTWKNVTTKHPSSMSPASANTGPLNNQTVVQRVTVPGAPYQVTVTNGATLIANGGVVFDATSAALTAVAASPTAGQYVSGAAGVGTYTFAAANTGAVLDITYSYSLTASKGVNISVSGKYCPDSQVGSVDIYRTKDGGATYYFLATIANSVGTGTWSYTDSTQDANLNNFIIAPVAGVNAPPPAGASLLCWYGGRLWAASQNVLFFSGGADTLNGSGQESWPGINNFTLPGNITALAGTSSGLIIWTTDNAYVLIGTSAATYTTPQPWQVNWGVQNQNSVTQDGDNLYIATTRGQVWNFGASGLAETGFEIEAQLGAFTPGNVYITLHRSGQDEGVFVGDGTGNIYRFSTAANAWDTAMQPVGGCGAIASIEFTTGNWRLLMGRPTGSGYILQRDTATYTDDSLTYPAWTIVGSLTVAPPRKVAVIESVLVVASAVGTYPAISVMLNEITDTSSLPSTFTVLPNPVADPPQLAASQTVWTRRHDLKAAQSPLPQHIQHMQVKITFPSEAAANELLGLGLDASK